MAAVTPESVLALTKPCDSESSPGPAGRRFVRARAMPTTAERRRATTARAARPSRVINRPPPVRPRAPLYQDPFFLSRSQVLMLVP